MNDPVFKDYAGYYDLLYQDKDYVAESKYVLNSLQKLSNNSLHSLLELGCGTGIHASEFSQYFEKIVAVDMSKTMLDLAQDRINRLQKNNISLFQGDARSFRSPKKYDAIISLFHVFSYQSKNSDVEAMIQTASEHLDPGGLFLFDFWFSPAVLTQRPGNRNKFFENNLFLINRKATPKSDVAKNQVIVNYEIEVLNKANNVTSHLREEHLMRYFSLPEVEFFLNKGDFDLIQSEEWLTKAHPSESTWGVCAIARKR